MGTADKQIFEATMQKEGSFIFVPIPFSPREAWGAKPRYNVTGTINGHPVRGSLGALGKEYFLRVSMVWVRESGIGPGAQVKVELSTETAKPVTPAKDVLSALAGDKKAKDLFDKLPASHQREYMRWIDSAKREETRTKRIQEMLTRLKER